MTKKLWLGAGFLPLVIAPAAIVASCSNDNNTTTVQPEEVPTLPSENLSDINKAFANIGILFFNAVPLIHNFLPSQVQAVTNSKNIEVRLGKLDPRQNFGFKTEFLKETDDEAKGIKVVDVKLTRGKETATKSFTIKGFLSTKAKEDEKTNAVNPEKMIKDFNRKKVTNGGISVVAQVKDSDGKLTLKDWLNKKPQELIDNVKEQILNSSQNQNATKVIGLGKIIQHSSFGVKENALRVDFQLETGSGTNLKKSGIYSLKVLGFADDPELFSEANLQAMTYGFATFNSPMKGLPYEPNKPKKFYSDKKASEINNLDSLKSELFDNSLTHTDNLIATIDTLVEGSQNDNEGSLKVNVTFKSESSSTVKIEKKLQIKLYGFKLNDNF